MPGKARICTTGFGPIHSKRDAFHRALELTKTAGLAACDLVLLPEEFLREDGGEVCTNPADVERMKEALQEQAAQYGMYVLAGLPHWEGGNRLNSAMLIDRTGRLVGVYLKIHPTELEIERGVTPGSSDGHKVFDLDFGRIGVLICFDIGWPNEWRRLQEMGAELVCWLSAYDGGFPLQAYAWSHRYYVISSVWSTEAKFIDMTGRILNQTSQWARFAIEEINLDRRLFHVNFNDAKLSAIQRQYGDAIAIRSYSQEGIFTLEPTSDRVSIEHLIQEHDLETFEAYHARVTKLQDAARQGLD